MIIINIYRFRIETIIPMGIFIVNIRKILLKIYIFKEKKYCIQANTPRDFMNV